VSTQDQHGGPSWGKMQTAGATHPVGAHAVHAAMVEAFIRTNCWQHTVALVALHVL
jgi:hypothetical protein